MYKVYLLFTVCLNYLLLDVHGTISYPSNSIKQGTLNGKYMQTRNGKKFSAYLSIPFAKPPVGELRFKPPVPAQSWDGTLNATSPHPSCPQEDRYHQSTVIEGDENCLYLNVYTPQLHNSEAQSYPVMIFIHGGGFYFGSGAMYGPDFLLDEEVVLVTINYRIGALGFLTTGNEIVPGNNGLKDQSLAIKWVHDNIRAFGGDSNKITLFGEAAGGASAHMHLFSSLSEGTFHAAISQSGTAFNIWALADRALVALKSKKLGSALGCPINDNREMVECLRTVKAFRIVEMDNIFMEWDVEPFIPFKPVIEINNRGAFLSEHPLQMIKMGKYANVPWVTGINSHEGVIKVGAIYKKPQLVEDLDQNFNDIMSIILENKNIEFKQITSQIRHFYFGDKEINNSTRFNLIDMFTDMLFLSAADVAVKLHLEYSKQPVYYYLFSHQTSNSFSQIVGDPHLRYGTSHADELPLLFPLEFLFNGQKQDELDKRFSHLITQLWTNFAKSSNPTPTLNSFIPTKWKPVETSDLEYYNIGGGVHMAANLYPERIKFWKNLNDFSNLNAAKDEL